MIMAATGHRPDKLGNDYNLNGPLTRWLQYNMAFVIDLYEVTEIISGMALGVDMLWAMTAVACNIPFIAAIPFEGQELKWPVKSQRLYWNTLLDAKEKVYVSKPGYAPWKMQKRNEWMVNNCDMLLAVWDGSTGGTFNCYRYAAEEGDKPIIRINPKNYVST